MGGLVEGIFGGGPDAPDPYKTAQAQGQANAEAARLTAQLNRANQYTPFGSQTWSQGGDWDEAGWNAAMEAYRQGSSPGSVSAGPSDIIGYTRMYDGSGSDSDIGQNMPVYGELGVGPESLFGGGFGGYGGGSRYAPKPPSKEDFGFSADNWASTVTLDPRLQQLLDTNIATQQGMAGAQQGALRNVNDLFTGGQRSPEEYIQMAQGRMGNGQMYDDLLRNSGNLFGGQMERLQGLYNSPMPEANEATRQRIEDALYSRMSSRLDPMYAQRESDLTSRMAAQGITQGSEAYGGEFGLLGRDRNDAYANALNNSILLGGDELQREFNMGMQQRNQGTQEALASMGMFQNMTQNDLARLGLEQNLAQGTYSMDLQQRNQALNELNALLQGTQVSLPQFGNTSSGANVQAAPVGQYIQDQYNAQMGSQNSAMTGLAGLGGSLLGAAGAAGGFGSLFSGI